MPATPDQVRKVMQQYIQAWTTGDKELFLSLFAPDARWADPVGSPEFVGHEAIGGFWDFARKGGRSLTPKLEEMRACANEGVLRFTMQVRIPERNEGLDLSIIDRFVLNGDEVADGIRQRNRKHRAARASVAFRQRDVSDRDAGGMRDEPQRPRIQCPAKEPRIADLERPDALGAAAVQG